MAEGPRSAGMVTCIACARVRARKRRRRLRRDPPPGLGPTAMMIATGWWGPPIPQSRGSRWNAD